MKKIFLLLLFITFGFPLSGNSQSAQRFYTALLPNTQGEDYVAVIPNASVYVCQFNDNDQCVTQIPIYADTNLTQPIVQPLLADGSGVYSYYVQSGTQVIEKVCAPYDQCSSYMVQIGDKINVGPGSGTVISLTVGNLPPIFTTTVTNPTTTPSVTFNLSNAGNLSFLGNIQGSTGPPSYVTLVAGSNITLTPSTGPNTLTIDAATVTLPVFQTNSINNLSQTLLNLTAGANITLTNVSGGLVQISAVGGGGSGCTLGGIADTDVLSVHPVGTCYGSPTFTWDDASGNRNLVIGDLTSNSNVQESYLIGPGNTVSASPSSGREDDDFYLIGNGNSVLDTSGLNTNNLLAINLFGDSNSVSATSGAGGIQDAGAMGEANSITSANPANSMFGVYLIGVQNSVEDDLNSDDDVEVVGNNNDVNGASSTLQILGHLNQAINVSYDSPLEVDQVIVGAQNLAMHTGGGTYSDYFEVFGHENYEHDCSDCVAVGSGVEEATNHEMSVGMSRIPELRFSASNVQRTPLTFSLPAPINTAQGTSHLPSSIPDNTICTVSFTGGTGSGGTGQIYVSGSIDFINHYSIQITNGGLYSVAPTAGTLSGSSGCSGTIPIQANLLVVQACTSGREGSFASITDSTTNSLGATITGGGSNHVFGYCNGTNWIVAAGGTSSFSTVVASAEVVSFSATPTFSTAVNVSRIVLTNNITSFTLGAGADGQDKTLCFKQGTGPYSVTAPSNVHGFFSIGNTNGLWNCQSYVYDNTDSIWTATTTGVLNE